MRKYTPKYLKKKLSVIFKKYPGIKLVYFFGSQLTRITGALSDVDIAILWNEDEKEHLLKEAGIQRKTRELLKDDRFEIGSLNDQALSFCYNVIKNGACIFGTEENRVKYETYILDEYLDFQYLAEQYNQAFKNSLLKGRANW